MKRLQEIIQKGGAWVPGYCMMNKRRELSRSQPKIYLFLQPDHWPGQKLPAVGDTLLFQRARQPEVLPLRVPVGQELRSNN